MKKIKILLLGYSSNKGGIETYIYNLIKNANKNVFSFSILCSTKKELPFEEELKKMNVEIFKIISRKENRKKHIESIKKVLKNNYDYIHFNIMSYSWYEPIIEASKTNSKIIIHSHSSGLHSYGLLTNLLHFIGKFKIRNINYIPIACSNEAGKFMFNSDNFIVCNNGIDIKKFYYNEENNKKIRNELKIPMDTFIFGSVAAFLPVKNHSFIIDVFYQYHKLNKNSKLLLIGNGPLYTKMLNKVNKLKIQDDVIFLGIKDNVEDYYSSFNTFILPSFSEGLGISLLEAQVNGLKCYTSTNVSSESNITGNVKYLSLNRKSKYWAHYIYNNDNSRDETVLSKILEDYNVKNSYKKVYYYYISNIKKVK